MVADQILLQAQHQYRSKALIGQVNWIVLMLSASQNCWYAFNQTRNPGFPRRGQAGLREITNAIAVLSAQARDKADTSAMQAFLTKSMSIQETLNQALRAQAAQRPLPAPRNMSVPERRANNDWLTLFELRAKLLADQKAGVPFGAKADFSQERTELSLVMLAASLIELFFGVALIYAYNTQIVPKILALQGSRPYNTDTQMGGEELANFGAVLHEMANELSDQKLQLQLSEQNLHNLLTNLPQGLVLHDGKGNVLRINDEAVKVCNARLEQMEQLKATQFNKAEELRDGHSEDHAETN